MDEKNTQKVSYRDTLKSMDTEETFDLIFYRPIGYAWACLAKKLGVTPNAITIASIFLGVAAGICFAQENLRWNITGILLLMWANLYDSTDGQLARITGKKTRWGRILDGFAGDVWFFFIYAAIAIRTTFQPIPFAPEHQWGVLIWILCSFAGFWVHGSQCQLADYYRNIHLYFMREANGHEFDTSAMQRKLFKEHTLQLMRYFKDRYPEFCLEEGFRMKLSDPVLYSYINGEIEWEQAKEHIKLEEQKWTRKAKKFMLYDDQPYRIK